MVANGVTAFFHGHDHQYAYEMRDGIVYQALPAAGFDGNGFGMYTTGDGYTIQALSNSGHLKVTVGPDETTVDYIRTGATSSSYTYTMVPTSTEAYDLTLAPGWNLVAGASGTTSFPNTLFGWNGASYVPTSAPSAWQGYWCNVEEGQTIEIQTISGPYVITLVDGWNLIGNSMNSAAALTFSAGGPTSVFAYDPSSGYVPTTTLLPGQGAWVEGAAGQTVTLTPTGG
jgi:hypothetical protein